MESILPNKPVVNIPTGIALDKASSMIDHEKVSHGTKHRSNKDNDDEDAEEDDDDQYVDDDDDEDDEDEDGQPHVQACHTH